MRWFGSPSASHSVGFALGGENVGVMAEAVEQGRGEVLIAEYLDPLAEGEVGGHQGGAALIAVGEQVEEQLAAGPVEGNEPQFVDDQQRRPLVALVAFYNDPALPESRGNSSGDAKQSLTG